MTPNTERSDIYLFANQLVGEAENLDMELFFINKNGVVYRVSIAATMRDALIGAFVNPMLEYLLDSSDYGRTVIDLEKNDPGPEHILRLALGNVQKASDFMHWVNDNAAEIEHFVEAEHDIRRIKGMVLRVTNEQLGTFYVAKSVSAGNFIKSNAGAIMEQGKLRTMDYDAVLRLPTDNHMLILGQDIYVFNQTKMEQLFNYNAQKLRIAQHKAAAITENFSISMPEGTDLLSMAKENKALYKKLQKVNPGSVSQDDIIDNAADVGVELMTDDNGAIIIMDGRDLRKFINLLSDDYVESPITGQRYEIRGAKKLIDDGGDE